MNSAKKTAIPPWSWWDPCICQDSWHDLTWEKFYLLFLIPGKKTATWSGSWQDPSSRWESWWYSSLALYFPLKIYLAFVGFQWPPMGMVSMDVPWYHTVMVITAFFSLKVVYGIPSSHVFSVQSLLCQLPIRMYQLIKWNWNRGKPRRKANNKLVIWSHLEQETKEFVTIVVIHCCNCVVPWNIHTASRERIFYKTPPPPSSPLKIQVKLHTFL